MLNVLILSDSSVCVFVSGTNTMALLEKLESGHVYLVKVSASNQAGDGPFSSTVELQVLPAKHHQSKNPRHTDSRAEETGTRAFTADL